MSEIEELHSRIMSAMDRVANGMAALEAKGAESMALQQALDAEKTANAELNERMRAMGEDHAKAIEDAEARATEATERMSKFDEDLQRLRLANGQLSEACEALRGANAEGVGDANLINNAMAAELEALRAARTAEVTETNEIIAALMPLLEAEEMKNEETA